MEGWDDKEPSNPLINDLIKDQTKKKPKGLQIAVISSKDIGNGLLNKGA